MLRDSKVKQNHLQESTFKNRTNVLTFKFERFVLHMSKHHSLRCERNFSPSPKYQQQYALEALNVVLQLEDYGYLNEREFRNRL